MNATRPFEIPKRLVWQAYRQVKSRGGAAGIDGESLQGFERNLKGNLYKIWNRMSSGAYFPPPVKGVPIPKKAGGTRLLGVPTVADRVAQTVVKLYLESFVEPVFHEDSYGYRPGRSAHDAIEVMRRRCWRYDWVVEFDIKGLFDHLDHDLLLRALRKHCTARWVLLYVERWLTAPMLDEQGVLRQRREGTPQGGVVSPLLANLFLHYAFDLWVVRHLRNVPFCRYADDGLLHCRTRAEAEQVLDSVRARFSECGLELHPDKTRIVYCQDTHRKGDAVDVTFEFLGYQFKPRFAQDRRGRRWVNFSPAVSRSSKKAMRQTMRRWKLQLKSDKSLRDLSNMFNPVLRGWKNYFWRFHASAMRPIWRHLNDFLVRWVMHKYRRFRGHPARARRWLRQVAEQDPRLFVHWELGVVG